MVLNLSVGVMMMNKAIEFLENNLHDETIVVATSGGPDSMALLYLVSSLKEKLNLKVICAHVNHKLRKESDDEEVMVKNFCDEKGLIFEILTIDNYNDDNFHNDARTKRYDFFEKCVKKHHALHLLTAHHGDDLMETILMRLVRGSSFRGYAGFGLKNDRVGYTILRPLIFYTKDEILSFVLENEIPYAIDKSNEKDIYTRNRFRKYILPSLKKEDINVHEKFYKFSKMIEMYDNYISKETIKQFNDVYSNDKILVDKFKDLDNLIQIRIIEILLHNIYQDDLMVITDKHVESIYELIYSEKPNKEINLPSGKKAVKSYNELYITGNLKVDSYEIELDEFTLVPNGKTIRKIKETTSNSNNICRLNSVELNLPLYIRNRKDGDKIYVKGLKGSKKIKDIFIDEKLSKEKRDSWPILVDSADNILWIPGIKKSKFDKQKEENYDIILEYI